jgi:methenyltetrahydrofolate cyclohydrolase
MLTELTVKGFLAKIASGEPVPGGGSVAALSGALCAALCRMVASLTIGRRADEEIDKAMTGLVGRASFLQADLEEAIDRDAQAYGRVMDAFRMAKGSEEEKGARRQAIQQALKEAALVPLSVAEAALELLGLAERVVRDGNRNAKTDGLVAALMARSGALGALLNVRINLASIGDKEFVTEIGVKIGLLEREVVEREKEILILGTAAIEDGA